MKQIAIFASGGGSNAQKIMDRFKDSTSVRVGLVISNKPTAGVLAIAADYGVPTHLITRTSFYESTALLDVLKEKKIEFIALAGFLWLIPAYLVQAYPRKMLNIHPALLPHYGGKGMYGHHVHEAVQAAGEQESGMTIHYVNEHYDEGDIVFQAKCTIDSDDSATVIAAKVLQLEHLHYASVIEREVGKST